MLSSFFSRFSGSFSGSQDVGVGNEHSHPKHEPDEAGSRDGGQRKKTKSCYPDAPDPIARLLDDDDDDTNDDKVFVLRSGTKVTETRKPSPFLFLLKELGSDVSNADARKYAKSFDGLSWLHRGSKSLQVDYVCGSHDECGAMIRLKYFGCKENEQGAQIYGNGEEHSRLPKRQAFSGRGVGGEWVEEIRNLKSGGNGAKAIRIRLQQKYGAGAATRDDDKAQRIPPDAKIEAHVANNLRGASSFCFITWLHTHFNDSSSFGHSLSLF